jgi:hypothetical protein
LHACLPQQQSEAQRRLEPGKKYDLQPAGKSPETAAFQGFFARIAAQ